MADIAIKCSACGETTAVSEYIDPAMAVCRVCGEKLKVPNLEVSGPRPAPEKKRDVRVEPAGKKDKGVAPGVFPDQRATMTVHKASAKRVRKRRRVWVWTPSGGTLLAIFLFGAGILSYLRFGSALSESDMRAYQWGGMICLLVGWLTVIVDSFNDNMMHGLLCLFVPFYFIYYLFWKCDSLLLRVGVGIFVIPFGYDTTVEIARQALAFLKFLGVSRLFNPDF